MIRMDLRGNQADQRRSHADKALSQERQRRPAVLLSRLLQCQVSQLLGQARSSQISARSDALATPHGGESLATCGRTTLLEAYWRSLAAMVVFQEQFVDARVRLRLDRTLVNDDLHRAKEKLEPVTGRSKAEAARPVWMNFAKLQVPKLQADPRRQRCSCRVSPDGA